MPRWIAYASGWATGRVVAFGTGLDVIANFGCEPAVLPDGGVVAASDDRDGADRSERLPPLTTVIHAHK